MDKEKSNATEMGYNARSGCDCRGVYSESRAQEIADSYKNHVLNRGLDCPSCGYNIGCFDLYKVEGKIISDPIFCENCGSKVRLKDNLWECELC